MCDVYGKDGKEPSSNDENMILLDELKNRIANELETSNALTLKNMAVNGNDLMKSGIKEGKKIGIILNLLLEKILDNPKLNDKETLLKLAIEANSQIS